MLAEAANELASADSLSQPFTAGGGSPCCVAFLAIALEGTGREAAAREAMIRLEALMRNPVYAADPISQSAWAEAKRGTAGR
jgi:hypothetical protein